MFDQKHIIHCLETTSVLKKSVLSSRNGILKIKKKFLKLKLILATLIDK